MSNVLSEDKKQQVIALGHLGWPLRRIEQETGVRRETASAYLKAAGIAIRPPGAWGRRPPAKPANQVTTGSSANPAAPNPNPNNNSNPNPETLSSKGKTKTAKPANQVTTGFGVELSGLRSAPLSAVCRAGARGFISGLSKPAAHDAAELPSFNCTCGIYAAKNIDHIQRCGYGKFGVRGEVYLWGRMVEHERGWRAEFAYPKSLFLLSAAIPFSLSAIDARLKTLTAFGTDIFIQQDHERLPLWKKGSGYDAAGLDYLINRGKEHYVRRGSERTLRKGDRVALLGLGIAVVAETDDREVGLVLESRRALRVLRKNIVLNEQNRRWECDTIEHLR